MKIAVLWQTELVNNTVNCVQYRTDFLSLKILEMMIYIKTKTVTDVYDCRASHRGSYFLSMLRLLSYFFFFLHLL